MEAEQDFYEFLVYNGIATEDELDLVTNCYGFTIDTFERVLYYREGYETMEQYLEAVDEQHIVVVGYPHQWKGEDVFTFWNLGEAVAFRNEMRRGLPGEEQYRTAEVYKLVV